MPAASRSALALSVCLLASSAAWSLSPDDLEGWWAYAPDGCFDVEDKDRVAIGRFASTPSGPAFGEGPFSVGIHGGVCHVEEPEVVDDVVTGAGACFIEGEEAFGRAFLLVETPFTVRLFMPGDWLPGVRLVRCAAPPADPR